MRRRDQACPIPYPSRPSSSLPARIDRVDAAAAWLQACALCLAHALGPILGKNEREERRALGKRSPDARVTGQTLAGVRGYIVVKKSRFASDALALAMAASTSAKTRAGRNAMQLPTGQTA